MKKFTHARTNKTLTHQQWQNQLGITFHEDRPPEYLSPYSPPTNNVSIETVKEHRIGVIRADAERSYEEPVTLPNNTTWNGGFESAQKIKSGAEMAEFGGYETFVITDINNDEHEVTIEEARMIAAGIGEVFQRKFRAKQAAMRAINAIDLESKYALTQIKNINFSDFL